jgi:tetratricopeptide (TPR) repeat protein
VSPDRWEQVEALFAALLETPPEQRAAYLASTIADPEARGEALSLLLAHEAGGRFDRIVAQLCGVNPAAESGPVPNLLDRLLVEQPGRLRAALAGRYTVDRELGHGGMATVYLAQDERHHRPVAIKVLRPEIAPGLGPERFLREIGIAARLNHPHILALLDSGDADGMLYYAMPFVEGESLRNRLTREPQLPLDVALQIAREVADALSYAHSHGVVHRDIKPENILLSSGHALVADFGIARAISAAAGHTLTETGLVIGTPAYMSPEQAAGSQDVDGRSDLYALGCVLYEMLSGEPPYTGPTPQAILAKKLTEPLPHLGTVRAAPRTVEAALAKALAKAPADRFQTVSEFAGALAKPPVPPPRWPMRATLRMAGLYALAGVAVLGVAYFLTSELGLPSWVISSTAVLLLVGLPIIVVTGLVEHRRAIDRTTGAELPAAGGLRGWFTWRTALVGGAAAFAALGLGTAVYMAMRVLGIGPIGTLVASGVLKAHEPLLLATFENRTTDSTLGPALSEAFRVDLSQSPTVKLLDTQAVADALQRMRRRSGTPLDLALARELARREGVKAVVTGEIDPVGKGYQLSASLVAARDGRVLTAVRETATDDRVLIGAIDRLSRALRERIGEPLKSIRATEPLEQVTTGSLEALRRYTQARQVEDAGDRERAAALYEEATTLDTGFAMAYRKLAVTLGHAGASWDRIFAAGTKAFALRKRLPDVERYFATAWYYSNVDYDRTKAIAAHRALLERDPDNVFALNNLALHLYAMRQFREAESLAVRATERDGVCCYAIVIPAQVAQAHFAAAETTLARFARAAPRHPLVLWTRALLASAQGVYSAAEHAARALRDEQRPLLEWNNEATFILAAVAAVQGKLSRAERDYEDVMALDESHGRLRWYFRDALDIAQFDLRLRHQPAEGLRRLEAALRRHPLATSPLLDRPYIPLSRYYAQAGRLEEAARLLAEYERVIPEGIRRGDPERHGAEGDLLLARGRIADAMARYQAWYDEGGSDGIEFENTGGLFEIATAYDQAGTPDSALTYYERLVTTPRLGRVQSDKLVLAPTYKRLGELYEARGDRTKAREYYGRFVDLWKDADPELQPMVRDVRARLAGLAGEH